MEFAPALASASMSPEMQGVPAYVGGMTSSTHATLSGLLPFLTLAAAVGIVGFVAYRGLKS